MPKKFTEIAINNVAKTVTKQSGYYVTVNYMYGDADGYKDIEYGPFFKNEEKQLLAFINMMSDCVHAFPNGKGGYDRYGDIVKDINLWMDCYDINIEDKELTIDEEILTNEDLKVMQRIEFEIEMVPDGYGCQAEIIGYMVQYYDANTTKSYNVELR